MKKILITEEEKSRILDMHKNLIIKEQNDPAMMKYENRRKEYGYDSPEDIQERLVILYLIKNGKNKIDAIKEVNGVGYENIITKFDGQNEDYLNWLVSVGLSREDVYVDNNNKTKVLTIVNNLEKK